MVLPVNNPTKSYWIEAANSPLRDFRSSDELPIETDVVIVGSGYAGAATAYWIHKYTVGAPTQPRVMILEARDICGSATGRNGGQLRPHAYSRYSVWSERFGPQVAMDLIVHEMAHLRAFRDLAMEENITEEICLKFGETFDAAMTEEAWARLKGALDAMRKDHGEEHEVSKQCRTIENASEAEEFTQMKGARAAVLHPAGQIWAYKFVHAILRILLERGKLNLQAHTPVTRVSERDAAGWITITTPRGTVRTRSVVHTTNRWASHLLPEFSKLILPNRGSVAAIKAPEGFIKHTGAQHWDAVVNNYHLQLPPPYNTIIIGGARQLLVHMPDAYHRNDAENEHIPGVGQFFRTWPDSDVVGWGPNRAELEKGAEQGGCWTGVETDSADGFPFVGPVPDRQGHFIAAGFAGHGMPRILLTAAHIAPLILSSLEIASNTPHLASSYPPLPAPFHVSRERIDKLQNTDLATLQDTYRMQCADSARKPFSNTPRSVC